MDNDASSLLSKPLEQISHNERMLLLGTLVDASIIKHIVLPIPDKQPVDAMLLSADGVSSGCTVRACSFFPFRATRFFILDTVRRTRDLITNTTRTTKGVFWKTTSETTTEEWRDHTEWFPAKHWSIRGMYAGNRSLLACEELSGDAFALDDSPFSPVVILPGVDFTVSATHYLPGRADFRALLFGVPLEE